MGCMCAIQKLFPTVFDTTIVLLSVGVIITAELTRVLPSWYDRTHAFVMIHTLPLPSRAAYSRLF
jgi:hypothetical protein